MFFEKKSKIKKKRTRVYVRFSMLLGKIRSLEGIEPKERFSDIKW